MQILLFISLIAKSVQKFLFQFLFPTLRFVQTHQILLQISVIRHFVLASHISHLTYVNQHARVPIFSTFGHGERVKASKNHLKFSWSVKRALSSCEKSVNRVKIFRTFKFHRLPSGRVCPFAFVHVDYPIVIHRKRVLETLNLKEIEISMMLWKYFQYQKKNYWLESPTAIQPFCSSTCHT